MTLYVVIIVVSLLLSAFFSGMEIAYVSSNKIHIEIEKKQEGILATVLRRLTAKPSKFITTMLIGNNIALVIYGFFMGDVLVKWFQSVLPSNYEAINYFLTDLSLLSQTIISTFIILITAEFLPKVFFQIYANTLLKFLAVPAYIFYVLFTWISDFVIWISDLVLKYVFNTEGDNIQMAFTKVELGNYISEQMESVEAHDEVDSEIQIFQNALEFSQVKAREVMVPRTEIIAVDINDTVKSLNGLFTETGCSKILVYKDSIDDILGYVHSFELFKKPKTIKSILLPVEFVPGTVLISDVLNILIKKRKSIAVVLDEYGGTSGIMTVEDIVEELFGEIEDEHDTVVLKEQQIDEDTYRFSARMEVDYINETYKINLPEDENYETLGGLIVNHTEEIPQKDEVIVMDTFQFTILEVSNTKIDLVEVKRIEED
ncbi:hemolysin family protein [Jejuia pallidilutea]|jgi:CBS domain containing-hemolysin-like protein|uniref:CBS domain containing-hemolysin-like protein n=1 Tax=Jejuia pallidilutea TaxID=504487 RepID=A0A090VXK3_9FLAO|nr:hemolysin family protein [Jejuia pallidilutea]PQV51207.1 CBS domain containing-hemolysin-like protein [Jejuia pallidilutea]GAL68703.1 magnesium and cobalt efflux protein CorC [Jejuia pallidilutea]GAL73065.1 magnesium and cobalt efflux protein CorC [Jejuia pallidilutea]GAL90290.1 magnesium and cobalt efflux protein CorC [Jejuia pallidilutea]